MTRFKSERDPKRTFSLTRQRALFRMFVEDEPGAPEVAEARPKTRGDCLDGGSNAARPCPYAGCRYHLALYVSHTGAITVPFGDGDVARLRQSCALDVVDAHPNGATLDEVGLVLNVSRERVRQIEAAAQRKLAKRMANPFETPEDEC